MSLSKKMSRNRKLNKYCLCSGRYLWQVGFKEGQFIHARGCPMRYTSPNKLVKKQNKYRKKFWEMIGDEKSKFVRRVQKLLSAK